MLKSLRKAQLGNAPTTPIEIRSRTQLQFLMDPEGHERRSNADDEFLTRARHLGEFVGSHRLFIAPVIWACSCACGIGVYRCCPWTTDTCFL